MSKGKPVKIEYQTLVIIWLALLLSQLVFLGFAWFAKPQLFAADRGNSAFLGGQPLITIVFAGSALVFFLLSQVISRQHMRRAILDRDAGCLQTGLVIGC